MLNKVKLGNISKFTRGITYSKRDEVDKNGVSVLRATNIDFNSNKLIIDDLRHIKKSLQIDKEKFLKKNDILICIASGSKTHLGKVALIDNDMDMVFGGFMATLRCNENCLPKYLFYNLISSNFKNHIFSLTTGININNLKFSQIENFHINLPIISEQRKIIKKLDIIFSNIDKKINNELKMKNVYDDLFDKVLEDSFGNNNLKSLSNFIIYEKVKGQNSGLKYIGMEDIVSKRMTLKNELKIPLKTSSTFKFSDKHVLFGRLRPYLKKIYIPNFSGQCSTEIFCILPNDKINKKYLAYWLLSPTISDKINNTCTGARMPRANMKSLLNFKIPLISKDEQNFVVKKIQLIFEQTLILGEILTKKLENLKSLKLQILKKELIN